MSIKIISKLLLLLALLAAPLGARADTPAPAPKETPQTAQPAPKQDEFFTPKGDRKGMKAAPGKLDPALPNVLILGDSISIAYTSPVRKALEAKANVVRPNANCGDTRAGLANLDTWLGDTKWDVIHFNWGLHDLCYRHSASKIQGNRDKVNGTQSVSPDDYGKNLEQLVLRLKKTGASLVWASTTLVPENEAGRFVGDDLKYNAIAAQIMERHGIPTNDLHAVSKGFEGEHSSGPGDVHFKPEGSAKLAAAVATSVQNALAKRSPSKTK